METISIKEAIKRDFVDLKKEFYISASTLIKPGEEGTIIRIERGNDKMEWNLEKKLEVSQLELEARQGLVIEYMEEVKRLEDKAHRIRKRGFALITKAEVVDYRKALLELDETAVKLEETLKEMDIIRDKQNGYELHLEKNLKGDLENDL